jgi:hypothetical protein
MSGKGSSPTGAQNQDEKKDHPRRDGKQQGQFEEHRFEDKQAEQAEGKRTQHSAPGNSGNRADTSGQPGPQDNTEPGGNRPKGVHHGKHVDHK